MRSFVAIAVLACLLTGCASTSVFRSRTADFSKYHHLWVQQDMADDHRIDLMIAAELRGLGYEVDTGPLTMMPIRGIDAIVSYRDEWTWDFRTYMVQIELTVQEPKSPHVVARSNYYRPGILVRSPERMVREVVTSVIPPAK